MGKLITYTCDKCGEENVLGNLEAISIYCYPTDETQVIDADISKDRFHEVKILEMEYVCPPCRKAFSSMIEEWQGLADD